MSKPAQDREAWSSYLSKACAGCPLITDPYVTETNRLWDTEGLSEAMRTWGWSMQVILSRFPSLLGIVKRNIDKHAVLEDRQMFSIQQEGVRMQIRSQVKPNLNKMPSLCWWYSFVIWVICRTPRPLSSHELSWLRLPRCGTRVSRSTWTSLRKTTSRTVVSRQTCGL